MLQSGGKGSLNASSENNGNGCSIGGDSEINAGNIVIHSCAHTQKYKRQFILIGAKQINRIRSCV